MTEVSVVIVNWNARDLLRNCLQSIEQQTKKTFEIIVIDNASSDFSCQMVDTEFPGVVLIENNINKGFAAANNQGLKIAKGRYLLLLNPDTVILDGAIDKMIDWFDAQSNIGCAGCQVLESVAVIQKTCFSDPSLLNVILIETGLHRLFSHSKFFGRPQYSWWDRRSEREVDVVSGMFMLMPKSVIQDVGMLDENYFIYAEEADICRRIRRKGLRCVFTPIAQIIHLDGGGKSTSQQRVRMQLQLQKSLLIYLRKHDGRLTEFLVKLMLMMSKLTRFALFGVLAITSKNVKFRRQAFEAQSAIVFQLFGKEPRS